MPEEPQRLTPEDVFNAALKVCEDSQTLLAERTHQSPSTISRWLNGKTRLEEGSALRLARLTGLDRTAVLQAFGYDAAELGLIEQPKPRRTPPAPAYDLRLLRVSEMLSRFAQEVRSMASASQPPHGSVQDASASLTNGEYVYQPEWLMHVLSGSNLFPHSGRAINPQAA